MLFQNKVFINILSILFNQQNKKYLSQFKIIIIIINISENYKHKTI